MNPRVLRIDVGATSFLINFDNIVSVRLRDKTVEGRAMSAAYEAFCFQCRDKEEAEALFALMNGCLRGASDPSTDEMFSMYQGPGHYRIEGPQDTFNPKQPPAMPAKDQEHA